ncbi:MAG: Gfo/Idh/MocA family oxidoreductase [Acidobacteria bacterium]|nr:Gfo/Idh/MocA family oxidoreductase [Acidobacteriota bacterium]
MTRRSLILAPSAAAWANGKPIRAAVYGTGHAHAMGKIQALRSLEGRYSLVGVCEPLLPRPKHQAVEGVRWLTEREMLDDASIELIAVESRVQENLAYARAAVDAGKFVHLDKAPGEDLAAFGRILHDAGRRQRIVQLGYQWRYHPAMNAAIEAARKGWLGEVHHVRASIDKPIPAAERAQLALFRGGMMFELGCHLVDRVTDLLGKPTRVTAYLWHHSSAPDKLADNTKAVLEYPRAMAEIHVAAMDPNGNSYRTFAITGTNGSMTVTPFAPLRLASHLKEAAGPYPAGRKEHTFAAEARSYTPDFLEMARVIREGAQPSYSARHDLMTQEVLLKACGF